MAKGGLSVPGHLTYLPWSPNRSRTPVKIGIERPGALTSHLVSALARHQTKALPSEEGRLETRDLSDVSAEQNLQEHRVWDPLPWAKGSMLPKC